MATKADPTAAVLDASAMVAYCCQEAGRDAAVRQYLDGAAAAKRPIYSPGAIVSESLFVFCKKRATGELDADGHAAAGRALATAMRLVFPPPDGEGSLVEPAAKFAAGYTCTKTTDSLYLSLAEQLAARGEVVEVVTFDEDQAKRADRLPGITGRCLTT